jgi:hypothetical protein
VVFRHLQNSFRFNPLKAQNYVTTDGHSASMSWCEALLWGSRPDFHYCHTAAGFFYVGPLSDSDGSVVLLVLASAVVLGYESRVTDDHILLSVIRDSPNLEGQGSICISPRNRVAQLYPHALGSLLRRLLRLAGQRWKYSSPPPREDLKTEFLLYNIQEFSSYLSGNTLRLRYKDQPVNAISGKSLFIVRII